MSARELTAQQIATYYRLRLPTLRQEGLQWRGPCPRHPGSGTDFAVDPASGLACCQGSCRWDGDIYALEARLHGGSRDAAIGRANALMNGQVESSVAEDELASEPRIDLKDAEGARKDPATYLVAVALHEGVELFHAADGTAYADIRVQGRRQTYKLKSAAFREWLEGCFFRRYRRIAGGRAFDNALATLQGIAKLEGPLREVHVRVAAHEDALVIDLGDATWSAIVVDAGGWRVVAEPPVRFRRPSSQKPLPLPEPDGSLAELRALANFDDASWQLVASWLLAALCARGPYPVLLLLGEQGSGKSTLATILKSLIDPAAPALRAEPRSAQDLMIAASNGWVLAFDNLSTITPALSDALCRLATGGGFGTRRLYTTEEEVLFDATRPVILTGIDELVTRPDLLDRTLMVELPLVSATQRRSEHELLARFESQRGRILGALLDALVSALREMPGVKLTSLPRLADFAILGTAAEAGLGAAPGSFMAAYDGNRQAAHGLAIENAPVAEAVRTLLERGEAWEGTASELLVALIPLLPAHAKHATPRSPKALGDALRRLAPNLRGVGIAVCFTRGSDRKRTRIVRIERAS